MESRPPPGYDPDMIATKPKSKSAKRNERKKEKRLQAALEKGKNLESEGAEVEEDGPEPSEDSSLDLEAVKSLTSQMNELGVTPPSESTETGDTAAPDIDKRIRALKKKIRLAEAQLLKSTEAEMKPEQSEKLMKIEGWREELKLLEDKKAEWTAS